MNMEYLSTVLCLFHSLLIMLYSFQCIGLSHPLFSLFLGILFFWLYLQKEFFSISFSEVSLLVGFCTMISCPATLLYLSFLIVFLVETLGFSM